MNSPHSNFSRAGAGGDKESMSRTKYDRAYTALYNKLAKNAYTNGKGKAPVWHRG